MNFKKLIARHTFKLRKGYTSTFERRSTYEDLERGLNLNKIREAKRLNVPVSIVYKYSKKAKSVTKKDIEVYKKINTRKIHFDYLRRSFCSVIIRGFPHTAEHGNKLINHYRKMGFQHFIFISERDSDVLEKLAWAHEDVTWYVFDINQQLESEVINAILHVHKINTWVLMQTWKQCFIFPLMENRTVSELIAHLDDSGKSSLFTPNIDCLRVNRKSQNTLISEACLYDEAGYYAPWWGDKSEYRIFGGMMSRVKHKYCEQKSSKKHQYGLFKVTHNTRLAEDLRCFTNIRQNHVHEWFPCPTGVILNDITYDLNDSEYSDCLNSNLTCTYVSSESLVKSELINIGIWK